MADEKTRLDILHNQLMVKVYLFCSERFFVRLYVRLDVPYLNESIHASIVTCVQHNIKNIYTAVNHHLPWKTTLLLRLLWILLGPTEHGVVVHQFDEESRYETKLVLRIIIWSMSIVGIWNFSFEVVGRNIFWNAEGKETNRSAYVIDSASHNNNNRRIRTTLSLLDQLVSMNI